jgi:hypothetical protein
LQEVVAMRGVRRAVPVWVAVAVALSCGPAKSAEVTKKQVDDAIEGGTDFVMSRQKADGSWDSSIRGHDVGIASLAALSLINCGKTAQDPSVAKTLKYLRSIRAPEETYDLSLMIMALAAAKDGNRDRSLIRQLALKLERGQIVVGQSAGLWDYSVNANKVGLGGDRSNGQFAVLALRDAAHAGAEISRETWKRIDRHWRGVQENDGGWSYRGGSSTGSMTAAGIATLSVTSDMLRGENERLVNGRPMCCTESDGDDAIKRGLEWMGRFFKPGQNPGAGNWLFYYLYGVERAGRLSGQRFFGGKDWYRQGAEFLVRGQNRRTGSWSTQAGGIQDPVVSTSLALLFLSKGLSPVLINKAKFGERAPGGGEVIGDDWNKHPRDVRNLVEHITGQPKWPKLLTWQVVDIEQVVKKGGVGDLLQSPILYLSGRDGYRFSDQEVKLVRQYIDRGGFVFAVNCCNGAGFDADFRDLLQRMFQDEPHELKRLPPEHPIFRAEYNLKGADVELYGVEFGCRTAIVYSPDDLSCLWEKWMRHPPRERSPQLTAMIKKKIEIGVNVVAYATGREPASKLEADTDDDQGGAQDEIKRGLLQVAKLRHGGEWDAAPRALRNLLSAMNRYSGVIASTKKRDLPATDENIFRYPVLYMHGREEFQYSRRELEQLRKYLEHGVLFADACCGSKEFDKSFRAMIARLFPEKKLERIPIKHPLFSAETGFDIRRVRRRTLEPGNDETVINATVETVEPFLEGIEIDGRLAVIYSKYDISCALEQQSSAACSGYLPEDALRIGLNILRHAVLQNISFLEENHVNVGE